MSISSIGTSASAMAQTLINMRAQFDDLQRQLSTGQKSATYAGLGLDRGLAVSLNGQLSAMTSFDNTIDNISTRVSLAQNALTAMSNIGHSMQSTVVQGTGSTGSNNTSQLAAQSWLQQLIGTTQHPGRRPLSVFRPCHRSGGVRELRSHRQRRRCARRPDADHLRARPGRSRHQRPRPPCGQRADGDLGAGRRRRRLAVRLQARLAHLEPEQRHHHRSDRLARLAVRRFHRPAQRRRNDHAWPRPARRHDRQSDADCDHQFAAR